VAVEALHSGRPQRREELGVKLSGELCEARLARELEGLTDEALIGASFLEQCRPGLGLCQP
jgi:hypothetical protein